MYILTGNKRYDDNGNDVGVSYRLSSDKINVAVTTGEKNAVYLGTQDVIYDTPDEAMEAFSKILAVAQKAGLANISDMEYPKPKAAPRKKAEPKQDPKVAQEEEAKE